MRSLEKALRQHYQEAITAPWEESVPALRDWRQRVLTELCLLELMAWRHELDLLEGTGKLGRYTANQAAQRGNEDFIGWTERRGPLSAAPLKVQVMSIFKSVTAWHVIKAQQVPDSALPE